MSSPPLTTLFSQAVAPSAPACGLQDPIAALTTDACSVRQQDHIDLRTTLAISNDETYFLSYGWRSSLDCTLLSAGEYIEREPQDPHASMCQHAEELLSCQESWTSCPL